VWGGDFGGGIHIIIILLVAKRSPLLGSVLYLDTLRQHGRLLRQTSRYSLLGSKGAPPPRADSFLGLEMRAGGA